MVHRIPPGGAAASSRAASTTGVPWQSPGSTVTSPTDRPIRIWTRPCGRAGRRSISVCKAIAASMASAALSNTSRPPSPVSLTTVPRARWAAPWIAVSMLRRTSSYARSPNACDIAVEPTWSV